MGGCTHVQAEAKSENLAKTIDAVNVQLQLHATGLAPSTCMLWHCTTRTLPQESHNQQCGIS